MFLPQNINKIEDEYINDIQFINIAYRPEPEVPTGGPNGVLKVLQNNLGTSFHGFFLRYYYEPQKINLGKHIESFFKNYKLGTITKKLIEADIFVQQELCGRVPFNFVDFKKKFIFICHDIGSAVGAYHAGFEYVLIYHQQGAFYFERESFGEVLSIEEKKIINNYEKIAFENAYKVFFPSKGAKDEFLSTTTNTFGNINFSNYPLYNTVPEINLDKCYIQGIKLIKKYELQKYFTKGQKQKYLIFMSIGDYSYNKGHDITFEILNNLAKKYKQKQILWIVCGTTHKSGIYEIIKEKAKSSLLKCVLIPRREDHDGIMYILSLVDCFIMTQRRAIFDFSTLEAMQLGKPIFLSKTGGNLDFNKKDNIIYLNIDNYQKSTEIIIDNIANFNKLSSKNIDVYNSFFSKENFLNAYLNLYQELIKTKLPNNKFNLCLEKYNYYYKDPNLIQKISNKDILIIGPGGSLTDLHKFNLDDYTVIALNSAYKFCKKIDIHCCQDNPPEDLLITYLEPNNILRLYGKIGRKAFIENGLDLDLFDNSKYILSCYLMSEFCYDKKVDNLETIFKNKISYDMRSVLFSAIQISVILGANSISLIGIDFSDININGKNPNKYNISVYDNFYELLKLIKKHNVKLKKMITTSADLLKLYKDVFENTENIELIEKKNISQKNTEVSKNQLSIRQRKIRKLKKHPILYFKDMIKKRLY